MKLRKYFMTGLLAVATACASVVAADAPPAPTGADKKYPPASNELLEKVQTELHKIKSIEADFDEDIYTKNGKKRESFKGHIAAEEPDHVIWIVKWPLGTAVRVLGEDLRIWTADPIDEKARGDLKTISLAGNPTYKSMAQQTRDWAGGNFKKLAESYDVFVEEQTPVTTLRFVPKPRAGMAGIFNSVSLTLANGYGNIQKIVYRKTDGEVYVLQLHAPRVNQDIPEEVWKIPPK